MAHVCRAPLSKVQEKQPEMALESDADRSWLSYVRKMDLGFNTYASKRASQLTFQFEAFDDDALAQDAASQPMTASLSRTSFQFLCSAVLVYHSVLSVF